MPITTNRGGKLHRYRKECPQIWPKRGVALTISEPQDRIRNQPFPVFFSELLFLYLCLSSEASPTWGAISDNQPRKWPVAFWGGRWRTWLLHYSHVRYHATSPVQDMYSRFKQACHKVQYYLNVWHITKIHAEFLLCRPSEQEQCTLCWVDCSLWPFVNK